MNNVAISPTMTVKQAEGYIASNMGGEKVMMSIESGKYYNLGEIGGTIWDMIETPASVAELVDALTKEYEVAHAECEAQVVAFLHQLMKEELIRVG